MQNKGRAGLRRRAGLTQHQLAKLVGKSVAAISLWETGQVEFPTSDVERIARALEQEIAKGPQVSNARQIAGVLVGATA
jgi:transcriptional regulator with XRE-family HTH domain